MEPPKMAFVIMTSRGTPCFANESFDRCMERVNALLLGQADSDPMTYPPSERVGFHIVRVEAE